MECFFGAEPFQRETLIGFIVNGEAPAALVFRFEHRGFSVVEHASRVVVAKGGGDADGNTQVDFASFEHKWLLEGIDDSPCHHSGPAGAVGAGAQYHELVTADSGERVARPHDGREALSNFCECGNAGLVTECVVGRFEAVEVDEQHTDGLLRSFRRCKRLRHPVNEEGFVGQTGEFVVEGLLDQVLFGFSLFGDVAA